MLNDSLRDLQLTELGMLKDYAEVSKKLGLTYFLNSGTLLGAVRHGGFIPWDDDIDIAMPFRDYLIFLDQAQRMLGDRFFVENMRTEPNFQFSFTRVCLNGTTCVDKYKLRSKIHHGVWIDIFPLVPVSGRLDFKLKRLIFTFCNYLHLDSQLDDYYDEFSQKMGKVGYALLKLFYKIPMEKRVRLHDAIVCRIGLSRPKRFVSVLWGNITKMYPRELFEKTSDIGFEGELFSAPADYDQYLRITYNDYMQLPPPEKRKGHGSDMIIDLDHDYHEYLKKND